jgi:uncharacterized membrane protein
MNEQGFATTSGTWGSTRVVYLQHGSDPVVFFSPSLAWGYPDWLREDPRSPDVSPQMEWFPLVTLWQVALDLPGAGDVPDGFGHMYSKQANAVGWVAVANPDGWTAAKTTALIATLDAQPTTSD